MNGLKKKEKLRLLEEIRGLRSRLKLLDDERKKSNEDFKRINPEYRKIRAELKAKVSEYRGGV